MCRGDRLAVEQCARLLAMIRKAGDEVEMQVMLRFDQALGKLGLTPADRSRVKVINPGKGAAEWQSEKTAPKNKFEGFRR